MTKRKLPHESKQLGRKSRPDGALLDYMAEQHLKGKSLTHAARTVAGKIDAEDHHDGTVRRRLFGKMKREMTARRIVCVGEGDERECFEIVPRLEEAMVRLAIRRKRYLPKLRKTKTVNP